MAPPCFALSHSFFTCRQNIRERTTIRTIPPATIVAVRTGCEVTFPKFRSNDPGTLRNMYR